MFTMPHEQYIVLRVGIIVMLMSLIAAGPGGPGDWETSNRRRHGPPQYYAGYAWKTTYSACFNVSTRHLIETHVDVTVEECLQLCWDKTSDAAKKAGNLLCKSVDYSKNDDGDYVCSLFRVSHWFDQVQLECCTGHQYFEMQTGWIWRDIKNACIVGHNKALLFNVNSLDKCKQACAERTDFLCESIDYTPVTNICRLQVRWRRFPTFPGIQEFKKPCGKTHYAEKAVSGFAGWRYGQEINACIRDHNTKGWPIPTLINIDTFDKCKERCAEEIDFICRSVEWNDLDLAQVNPANSHKGHCHLSTADSTDSHYQEPCLGPETAIGWRYSEKYV